MTALATSTSDRRDRYVDFLRAASISTVVLGHWLISIVHWQGGVISSTSVIGVVPGIWVLTWVLQVMPIFFFVGGFSNLVAYGSFLERGETTWSFIRSRIERLLRPSAIFLAVWTVIQVLLHVVDLGASTGPRLWAGTSLLRGMRPPPGTIPFGPLWFLIVYLLVVVVSPLTVHLNRRFGWWVPSLMAVGAVVTDVVGFAIGSRGLRFANVAFTLLLPHQLGHLYADGRLLRAGRRLFIPMVVVGLALLVVLTDGWIFERLLGDQRFRWFPTIGHYPRASLGTDTEPISNAYPPTVVFMLVGIWTIGAVMMLRDRMNRWLMRPGPWKATIVLNSMTMSLFLWHMTAYLVAVLILWPMGLGRSHPTTASWWLERPLWLGVSGLILALILRLVGPFERRRPKAA